MCMRDGSVMSGCPSSYSSFPINCFNGSVYLLRDTAGSPTNHRPNPMAMIAIAIRRFKSVNLAWPLVNLSSFVLFERDNVRVHRGAVEIIASQNRGAGVSVWNVLLSRCLPQLTCFDHACDCARHCLRHVSLSIRLMRESSRFCTSMSSAPNATPMD